MEGSTESSERTSTSSSINSNVKWDCETHIITPTKLDHLPHKKKTNSSLPYCCSSCRQVAPLPLLEEIDASETYELGNISIAKCTSCHKFLGLLQDKNNFYTADSILSSNDNDTAKTGWCKVETIWERMVLFVLSQVVYKNYEVPNENLIEVEFAFPPPTDLIKILWVNKQPVGFYSVKLKGTLCLYMMEYYRMTTMDTLFIRQTYRGQGWGASAVKDLLLEFPYESIGFSFPISIPMSRVLKKYLEVVPSDRSRFWEITGCGTEGNTRNLWLMFQRQSTRIGLPSSTNSTLP